MSQTEQATQATGKQFAFIIKVDGSGQHVTINDPYTSDEVAALIGAIHPQHGMSLISGVTEDGTLYYSTGHFGGRVNRRASDLTYSAILYGDVLLIGATS